MLTCKCLDCKRRVKALLKTMERGTSCVETLRAQKSQMFNMLAPSLEEFFKELWEASSNICLRSKALSFSGHVNDLLDVDW